MSKVCQKRMAQACNASFLLGDQLFNENLPGNLLQVWDVHLWWKVYGHVAGQFQQLPRDDPKMNFMSVNRFKSRLMKMYDKFCQSRQLPPLPNLFEKLMDRAQIRYKSKMLDAHVRGKPQDCLSDEDCRLRIRIAFFFFAAGPTPPNPQQADCSCNVVLTINNGCGARSFSGWEKMEIRWPSLVRPHFVSMCHRQKICQVREHWILQQGWPAGSRAYVRQAVCSLASLLWKALAHSHRNEQKKKRRRC